MTMDDNDNSGGPRNVDAVISRNGIIVSLPPLEYKSTLIGRQCTALIVIPKATQATGTENLGRDGTIAQSDTN